MQIHMALIFGSVIIKNNVKFFGQAVDILLVGKIQ